MKAQKGSKKYICILLALLGSLAVVILACYGAGIYHYRDRFLPGTVIDRIDVSGMTLEELETQLEGYFLRVLERQSDGTILEEDIEGEDIGLSYLSREPLEEILQSQNKWIWFLPQAAEHRTEELVSYDEEALAGRVRELRGFKEDFYAAPADAYISEYTPGVGFEMIPEEQGNQLNYQKTLDAVCGAVSGLEEQANLEEAGCYEVPEVTAEDERLVQTFQKLQSYAGISITYHFGENQEVLNGDIITSWLHVSGIDVSVDREQVKAYVNGLRKKYDTIFHSRTFHTSYGTDLSINEGDYGWWMDCEKETEELAAMLERGESGERTPVYYQTAAEYGMPDYGNSYVEINLTAQHLFLYKNGNLVLESDFVSGNPSRGNGTPAGIYSVTYKERDATLKGENYRTPVSYWMPFNGNVGMHDASWRSSFGGTIYKTNGSHGCINLPYPAAQQIYEEIEKGWPVICYYLPGTEPKETESEQENATETGEGEAAEPLEGAEQGAVPESGEGIEQGTIPVSGEGAEQGAAPVPGEGEQQGETQTPQ